MGLLDRWTKKKEQKQLAAVEKPALVKAEKKAESKTAAKPAAKKTAVGAAYKVLLQPLISEKAAIAEAGGVYTFVVDARATKTEVKKAVKQVYGLLPKKVRLICGQGKYVSFGRRYGRRNDWKKAMVTMPKGQTINVHEGV